MSDEKKAASAPETSPEAAATPATPAAAGGVPASAAPTPEAKLKPPALTAEQITAQNLTLKQGKDQLSVTLKQVQAQLHKIQTALHENEALTAKNVAAMADSYTYFLEEWKRKSDYYPEIRLAMIQKAAEAIAPKKK